MSDIFINKIEISKDEFYSDNINTITELIDKDLLHMNKFTKLRSVLFINDGYVRLQLYDIDDEVLYFVAYDEDIDTSIDYNKKYFSKEDIPKICSLITEKFFNDSEIGLNVFYYAIND